MTNLKLSNIHGVYVTRGTTYEGRDWTCALSQKDDADHVIGTFKTKKEALDLAYLFSRKLNLQVFIED